MQANVGTPMDKGPRLFEGESIVRTGTAQPAWFPSLVAGGSLVYLLTGILVPFLPLMWWAMRRRVARHRWWLTDRRLIVANGIVGRSVRSVALDKIVDVTVQSSWWDTLWGLEHVSVRDMTGETSANGVSTGLVLQAVDDAEGVADTLMELLPQGSGDEDLLQALRRLVNGDGSS